MILEAAQVKQIQLWWMNIFPSSSVSHETCDSWACTIICICWGLLSLKRSVNEYNLNVSSKSSFYLLMNFFCWCSEIFPKYMCIQIIVQLRWSWLYACVCCCFVWVCVYVCCFVCVCVCAFCDEAFHKQGITMHSRYCEANPNRKMSRARKWMDGYQWPAPLCANAEKEVCVRACVTVQWFWYAPISTNSGETAAASDVNVKMLMWLNPSPNLIHICIVGGLAPYCSQLIYLPFLMIRRFRCLWIPERKVNVAFCICNAGRILHTYTVSERQATWYHTLSSKISLTLALAGDHAYRWLLLISTWRTWCTQIVLRGIRSKTAFLNLYWGRLQWCQKRLSAMCLTKQLQNRKITFVYKVLCNLRAFPFCASHLQCE